MKIYVIANNGGYEGHSPPIQAFFNLDEAKAGLSLAGGCFELFEVPVWPEQAQEWFRIEPMKVA